MAQLTRKKKNKKSKNGAPAKPFRPPLSVEHVKILARSLLTAIDHCHSNGNVAHADIKATNIMVDANGTDGSIRFVLCDFGCAEACDDAGNIIRGKVGGSRRMAAPEQRECLVGRVPECGLSRAIDLASAGFLLSEVVAYWAEPMQLSAFARYKEHLPEWVPQGCADLIYWLTEHSPSDRPTAKEALAHWWLNE
jgi:serine/threonine protein kinase